jgi:MFS family permease
MGISEAVCQISTIAYVADRAGKRLFGAAVGIVGTFFDLGLAAGQFLPGLFIPLFGSPPRYAAGYLPSFGIVSGTILLSALAISRVLKEPSCASPPPPDKMSP